MSPVVTLAASLLAWTVFTLTPLSIQAADLRQGDTIVVPAGETINDDFYAFGQSVTILGVVNGDLIAGGRTVTIQGAVNGNVIAGGQSINVSGPVRGDVMAAGSTVMVTGTVGGTARLGGQSVEINAPVSHDLLAGAATVNVGPTAPIGRDLLVGGSAVTVGGAVGRSIRAGAERLTIGGPVGGDVMAQVGTLRLTSDARVQGALSYTSSHDVEMDPGATVQGMTTRTEPEPGPVQPSPAAQFGAGALAWLKTLVGISLYGLALVLLFPGFSRRATETLARAPWPSLGLGSALLIGAPLAAVLIFGIGLLIGGWWLGPLLLALCVGSLPIGYAIVGLFLGRFLMRRAGRPHLAAVWSLLAGLILLSVVSLVPLAGGLAIFAAVLFGLGACMLTLNATYRGRPLAADAPVSTPTTVDGRLKEPAPARP